MPSLRCLSGLQGSYLGSILACLALGSPRAWAETQTLVNDTIGIQFQIPDETLLTGQNQPGQAPYILLRDGGQEPEWSLRLEGISSDAGSARNLLVEYLGLNKDENTAIELLDQSQVVSGKVVTESAWILERTESGEELAFGWFVMPLRNQEWLVGTAITMPRNQATSKSEIEHIIQSIRTRDLTMIQLDREASITRGQSLLDSITEEALRSLAGTSQLYRLYRSHDGITQEVGYNLREVTAGARGQIKRNRSVERYTNTEKEEGLLVKEHGRFVIDASRGIYVDVLSLQWMSWDMQREAWTITATRRQGELLTTETEVGFQIEPMIGNPRAQLHVIRQDIEIDLRQPFEWDLPETWLPRPLAGLMSRLVGDEPASYGFYSYDTAGAVPNITLRTDSWEQDPLIQNRLSLLSRSGDQAVPTRSTFGQDGNLLRQVQPDGTTIEPTTAEAIQRYWEKAGLKIE